MFPISAPILPPFWSAVHDFGTPFSSIDFALIVHWFLIDFWYPWSCEKTILTLYSSQKTRNHRFGNVIDLSLSFDIVVASFWDHFLISFHRFSTLIFALILGCMFYGKWLPKGSSARARTPPKIDTFHNLLRTSIVGCILVDFSLPMGSLLAPFGSFLTPFWSLWLAFRFHFEPLLMQTTPPTQCFRAPARFG